MSDESREPLVGAAAAETTADVSPRDSPQGAATSSPDHPSPDGASGATGPAGAAGPTLPGPLQVSASSPAPADGAAPLQPAPGGAPLSLGPQGATSLYEEFRLVAQTETRRAAVKAELLRRGHPAESVQVLVNTLPPGPRTSPLRDTTVEVNLDPTTHALTPRLYTFFDLGLSGDRATVALYWLTFGISLGVITTIVLLAGDLSFLESTSGAWARFAFRVLPWVGYGLGLAACVRGVMGLLPYLFPRKNRAPGSPPGSPPPGDGAA